MLLGIEGGSTTRRGKIENKPSQIAISAIRLKRRSAYYVLSSKPYKQKRKNKNIPLDS